jgi:colanic acid biosynthesis glycosyl transferase WcaI
LYLKDATTIARQRGSRYRSELGIPPNSCVALYSGNTDLQQADRLNDLLNLTDIHLLPQRPEAADLLMPCKLTGMMASGRAIVATAHPGTEVAEALIDCGLVVPPGSIEAFVNAVQRLAAAAGLRSRMGKAGQDYAVRHLSRHDVLKSFEFTIQTI